jgi:protocatechuate 3,4-dioxygenase beta subunit
MTTDFSEDTATAAVIDSFADCPDARLKLVLEGFVRHLHGFIREVEPTQREWDQGITFLTEVGQRCDGANQEFILLSDVLGVSMLVDAINNRAAVGATASTVLGPFHVEGSPPRELGADIALADDGPRCVVRGTVRSVDGQPLPGAVLDIWQADATGSYDIQQPGRLPEHNLRGVFTTNESGEFWFRTIVPRFYPIPEDGPVGQLLRATKRHPNRPAHIHFIGGAAGFTPVVTHLFIEGSPYLEDDSVFGVKKSLIREVQQVDDPAQARRYGVSNPFEVIQFDLVLHPNPADDVATSSAPGLIQPTM